MFCTKCGIETRSEDKFCAQCGEPIVGRAPASSMLRRLSRPTSEAKIAGVCAGFARYFELDVTVVRVLWLICAVWPVPTFGFIGYLIAWIAMPKDPVALPAPVTSLSRT